MVRTKNPCKLVLGDEIIYFDSVESAIEYDTKVKLAELNRQRASGTIDWQSIAEKWSDDEIKDDETTVD